MSVISEISQQNIHRMGDNRIAGLICLIVCIWLYTFNFVSQNYIMFLFLFMEIEERWQKRVLGKRDTGGLTF